MKIKREHYDVLKSACESVLAAHPHITMATYQAQGLSAMRFNWDVLNAARINGERSCLYLSDVLYPYLNDTHIGTALASIMGNDGTNASGKRR